MSTGYFYSDKTLPWYCLCYNIISAVNYTQTHTWILVILVFYFSFSSLWTSICYLSLNHQETYNVACISYRNEKNYKGGTRTDPPPPLEVCLGFVFSSPELKAQVSFSDHLSSGVCLSVRPSVCLSVNFSHFHLLLQNHWANFNQTWHKVSLGEGD